MASARAVSVVLLPRGGDAPMQRSLDDALAQRAVGVEVLVPGRPARQVDPRVRYLGGPPDPHPADAIQAALDASRARWVAFLEPGDRWHPDRVRRTLAAARAADAGWVYGARVLIDSRDRITGYGLAQRVEGLRDRLRGGNVVGGASAVVCHRSVLARRDPFDRRLRALTYWMAWLILAGEPAAVCPELLVAERADQQREVLEPRAAIAELQQLQDEGTIDAGPRPHLQLADRLRALGHGRRAAAAYASAAARHRRPQHMVRAMLALRGTPPPFDGFEPPRWLAPSPQGGASRIRRLAGPEVSVVIATRNRPHFLRQAVRSALAQQDVDIEILIVDDASDREDARRALVFDDRRVRVELRSRSGGAGRARNDALKLARGEWVAVLDDDDVMAPGRLAAHLDVAGEAGFSFCGQVLVDPQRRVVGALPAPRAAGLAERLRVVSSIGGPSAVIARTALLREVGGFREDLYALGDWDLWVRLTARAVAIAIPELLVAYTLHPANMHLRAPHAILEDFERFDALHAVGAPAEVELLRWLVRDLSQAGHARAAARLQLRLARRARGLGELAAAARLALRGRTPAGPPPFAALDWLEPYRSER